MSSSDSSDDEANGCSCRHHNGQESDSDSEESSDYEDDDDSSDDSSDEEFINDRKYCYVGVYGEAQHYDTVIVCTATEIKKYRQKYSSLTQKNPKNIDIIWGDVKIHTPNYGKVPVKIYKAIGGEKPPPKEEPKKSSCNAKKDSSCKSVNSCSKSNASTSSSQPSKPTNNLKGPSGIGSTLETKSPSDAKVNTTSSTSSITKTVSSSPNIQSKSVAKDTTTTAEKTDIKKTNIPSVNVAGITATLQTRSVTPSSVSQVKITPKTTAAPDDSKKVTNANKTSTPSSSAQQTKNISNDSIMQNKKTVPEKSEGLSALKKSDVTKKGNELKSSEDKKIIQNKMSEANFKSASEGVNPNTSDKTATGVSSSSSNPDKSSKVNLAIPKHASIVKSDVKVAEKLSESQTAKTVTANSKASKDSTLKIDKAEKEVTGSCETTSKKKSKKQKRRERLLEKENSTRDSSLGSLKDKSEMKKDSKSSANDMQAKKSNSKNEKISETQNKKSSIASSKKTHVNKQDVDEDSEDGQASDSDTSDNDELLTDTENIPAFIAEAVKHKQKKNTNQSLSSSATSKKSDVVKSNTKHSDEQESVLQINQPTVALEKAQQVDRLDVSHIPKDTRIRLSDQCTRKAVKSILKNNLMEGLHYINDAINYCENNLRLYLNRSYCYLRMNQNNLALADAQHVLLETSNYGFKFMANLRAGQASLALKEFQNAEKYFSDAVKTNPYNHHARRELMRAKITHLIAKGCKERDVLLALRKCSSFWDAMKLDTNSKIQKNGSFLRNIEDSYNLDDCDHLVYASDDDEKSSSVGVMNQFLKYIPGKTKLIHTVARPLNIRYSENMDKGITMGGKANAPKKVEEKSVWVGNLTSSIDEMKLTNAFRKFGIVKSVYRPVNGSYAFINFDSCDEVSKILNSPAPVIDGIELAIRSARHRL
ncbi:hypothetical protein QAD02_020219 [Eretmocerus hayati]|uniref:Uncharacterized protein n=1 Tax=Eretmocerus hayati TaxID=131215 RepID=A0ACC2PM11_9HYME|nr:hypothetical protein QAD02_020219 [Eretmocerus hayati]